MANKELTANKHSQSKTNGNLSRYFTFWTLVIYGVGDIVGAGIFALVGEVAAKASYYVWLSFAVALGIALLSALGYAELTSRFPKSGGVSYFAHRAFNRAWVSFLAGWLLFCTTSFSMATITKAFNDYLATYELGWPPYIVTPVFLLALALINFRGIKHSSTMNIIATSVSLVGLFCVIAAAGYFVLQNGWQNPILPSWSELWTQSTTYQIGKSGISVERENSALFINILRGASLAFFAFIGFEDMANVAEEVKEPRKTIPRALLSSVFITGSIYIVVSIFSLQAANPQTLADAGSGSLSKVVEEAGFTELVKFFAVFALFAVSNTCLLNSITSSRLLYGMANMSVAPSIFNRIHKNYKTPFVGIIFVFLLVYGLTFLGDLAVLAGATSTLILCAFVLTNLSLIQVKRRNEKHEGFHTPTLIPILGSLTCLGLMFFNPLKGIALAVGIVAVGVSIFWILVKMKKLGEYQVED